MIVDLRVIIQNIFFMLLLFVIIFISYLKSFQTPFLFDDESLIVNNYQIKNARNITGILTADFFSLKKDAVISGNIGYYRPVITLSYMIDYHLWGLNAKGFHLTNIILHFLTVIALYCFLNILFKNIFFSFCCALLFAVHPIQTESVVWISGRTDLFGALFFFFSIILFALLQKNNNKKLLFGSLIFFCCGLLAKETVVVLPFLLICYMIFFSDSREEKNNNFKIIAYYFIILLLYFILRIFIVKIPTPSFEFKSAFLRFYTFIFGGLPYYFGKLFFPVNLNVYLDFKLLNIRIFHIIIIFIFIAAVIFLLKKYYFKISKETLFFVCFFILSLLPVSNILPISLAPDSKITIAERFMYLPSVSFIVIFMFFIFKIKYALLKNIIVFGIIVTFVFFTYNRINDWKNEEKLLLKALMKSSNSLLILNKLGSINETNGNYKNAMDYYQKVYNINNKYIGINNNLANIYMKTGDYQNALKHFENELKFHGENAVVFNNIGMLFFNIGKKETAMILFNKSIKLQPDYSEAYNNMGAALALLQRFDEAEKFFNYAIYLSPEYSAAKQNLELLKIQMKK